MLEACGISAVGKTPETILSEFQRGGFFLAHAVECAREGNSGTRETALACLESRIGAVAARVRRSLKPKRVVLISELLTPLVPKLSSSELGCEVILRRGEPFAMEGADAASAIQSLKEAITAGRAL